MFNKSPIDIDRPMYDNIPKDIAEFIETESRKNKDRPWRARDVAAALYKYLISEYKDFANYLIGMYGQVNIAQEKKIADLTQQLKDWEENWNRDNGYPDNSKAVISKLKKDITDLTLYKQELERKIGDYQQVQIDTSAKIIELKKDLQDRTDACRCLTDCLVLQKEQQEGRGKRISDPADDKAPIKAMRRMVITLTERKDGTTNVQHTGSDMPILMAIGILDTLRVKFVSEMAEQLKYADNS